MVISYMGGECFKITQGDLTLSFNPPSKDSNLKSPKFGADIALITLDNEDFNGAEQNSFGEREPFVIEGPGEYEIKGVAVRGFGSESQYGGEKSINTIYSVMLEGMNLLFLGALASSDLPQEAKQELDDIDILFLPIGGEGVLEPAASYKLAVQLEPKLIVPMHYPSAGAGQAGIGGKDSLKLFLKEAGSEASKPEEKLTIKKKDLEGKEGDIVVLGA